MKTKIQEIENTVNERVKKIFDKLNAMKLNVLRIATKMTTKFRALFEHCRFSDAIVGDTV